MCKTTILLAENNPDYLATCRDFLTLKGYRVLTATNPREAESILETRYVHLAVVDKRLTDDTDEKDISGIALARQVARDVPKVILTNFPHHSHVREAMRRDADLFPPAVDFLDKRDIGDLTTLAEAVEQVLAQHGQLNRELRFVYRPPLTAAQLVSLLAGREFDPALLPDRLCELEDLFRRIFQEATQVTLDSIVTMQEQQVTLKVYVFPAGGGIEQYLVSCYAREGAVENGHTATAMEHLAQQMGFGRAQVVRTIHYEAVAYPFMAAELEGTYTLADALQQGAAAHSLAALDRLFGERLRDWYARGQSGPETESVATFYQQRWHNRQVANLEKQLTGLLEQMAAAGLALAGWPLAAQAFAAAEMGEAFPDPVAYWEGTRFRPHKPVPWGNVHGRMRTGHILTNPQEDAWLTDISSVSKAPLLHDFATLETDLKLQATLTPAAAQALEKSLGFAGNQVRETAEVSLPEQTGNVRALVQRIRDWATKLAGYDAVAYQTALYYLALEEVARFEPQTCYTRRELARFGHALLLATVSCQQLAIPATRAATGLPQQAQEALWLDGDNKQVIVEGRPVTLSLQDFTIMTYLYAHRNQLVTRRQIVEEALGEVYDRYDKDQSRLNSAMSRLRRKIEPNPRRPKYLLTVRGRGYRLVLPEIADAAA